MHMSGLHKLKGCTGELRNQSDRRDEVLQSHSIAGAALDVFDQEALPTPHPFRALRNRLIECSIEAFSEVESPSKPERTSLLALRASKCGSTIRRPTGPVEWPVPWDLFGFVRPLPMLPEQSAS
jgi:hypothetical protein